MTQIASDQAPQARARLAADDAARRDFAKNVRELLSVAEEAKAKGIAYRPEIRRQMELVRAIVIAQTFAESQGGQPVLRKFRTLRLERFKEPAGRTVSAIREGRSGEQSDDGRPGYS